jgi:hypothetical protein
VLVRGRRVYPRHLFPEFVAPWIHYKRFRLRVVWFFTSPIHIKPLWMSSVVCGIFGVMLTILLFRHSPQAHAATASEPVTVPAANLRQPEWNAQPLFQRDFEYEPIEESNGVDLDAELVRTTIPRPFNPTQQVTHRSDEHFNRRTPVAIRRQDDGWSEFNIFQQTQADPLSPYRSQAETWTPQSFSSRIASSDQPSLFGGVTSRQPGLVVFREDRASAAGEPVTYDVIVRNIGAESLFDLLVAEHLSDVDTVISARPAAGVSGGGLHWVIAELPSGEEQRFTVTLQPTSGADVSGTTEVRSAVDVSAVMMIHPAPEPVSDEPLRREPDPAVLMETPEPSPFAVEPASSEFAPPERSIPGVPRIAITGKLPESVFSGQEVSTVFEITNSGTAEARDIILTLLVPDQLEHHDGKKVQFRIRSLAAGATRRAMFRTIARKAGLATVDGKLASRDEPDYFWSGDVSVTAGRVSSTGGVARPEGR